MNLGVLAGALEAAVERLVDTHGTERRIRFHCLNERCLSGNVMVSTPYNGHVNLTCKDCGWTHWNVPLDHERVEFV